MPDTDFLNLIDVIFMDESEFWNCLSKNHSITG